MLCGGGYELFVIPALVAGISLRAAPVSMRLCERVGLALRIEIPAAVRGNDGGVSRLRAERVPDQVGDGGRGVFPAARRSELTDWTARSKAEMWWSASIRAAVGATMASGGGSELFVLPALVVGISLRPVPVSMRLCERVGLALRIEIPAALRGNDEGVAQRGHNGGVARYGAERVPDQVGDGEWGEFPGARRSELTDWTARSKAEMWWSASIRAAVGAAMASGGGYELFVIPAIAAGISLRAAPGSMRPCEHVGLALRIEIPAVEQGNDGGVARYGAERVPDQVGDGEWGEFPVARRSELIGSSARSKAEMWWSVSIRAAVGATMLCGGGSELLVLPALVVGISLRPVSVSMRLCERAGLALRIEIPAAVRGNDGVVAEQGNDGGVSRLRAERVPDQVGDWKQGRASRSGARG